ncbi:MAG: hypothetical protein H0X19_15565 [Rubrobacter sp.]|nr:hypothetical protein [Rubrobacter sp.]
MQREPGKERERVGDLMSGMGRERMALRAKKVTVFLTVACSFVCLGTALGGFTGYVLPHAVGPAIVFLLVALAGFVLSVTAAGSPRW